MSIYERTSGNAYSGDDAYDRLTGYVTGNYVSEWHDRSGTKWRCVTTIINLGRADGVTPAEMDAQLAEEAWDEDAPIAAIDELRRQTQANAAVILAKIAAYLDEHKQATIVQLEALTGYGDSWLRRTMRGSGRMVEHASHTGAVADLWTLVGTAPEFDTPARRLQVAITADLETYGLSTYWEIANRLGVGDEWIRVHLKRHSGVYFARKHKGRTVRWGVIGVHDQSEASSAAA